jgi:predicted Zn-dependent protease with MMP-like domain
MGEERRAAYHRCMERARFKELVEEAVDSLPAALMAQIDNLEIVVERRPSHEDLVAGGVPRGSTLLGLYHGIPLTARGEYYNLALPDKISIYQETIEAMCRNDAEVREQVRTTVLHEIAHYFGIDDDRLHELGMG